MVLCVREEGHSPTFCLMPITMLLPLSIGGLAKRDAAVAAITAS